MKQPETASFRDFATIARFKPSYITQLKADGRLVLTEDGKAVRVAESLARIRETRDPAKAGVAARHAAARGEGAVMPPISAPDPSQGDDVPDPTIGDQGFQHWRARSEKAKALAAERDNLIADGKLLDAGEVTAAVASAIVTLRTRLEGLPDVLGPQLAGINDEARARALLAEAIEHELEETSRQFAVLAKQVAA